MDTRELLALAYERSGYKSWKRFAASVGITDTNFRRIRRGHGLPGDELACTLAAIAGVDPCTALLQLNVERSEGAARRFYQKALRERSGPSIAAE